MIIQQLQHAAKPDLTVLRHEKNSGKGAAIRTGLRVVTGDLVLVQDADLEYDPADYGLDRQQLREQYQFYTERYDVPLGKD